MTYQIWEDADDGITLSTMENCQANPTLLGLAPVMVLEFEASSWDEACRRKYEYYGWEPYVSFEELS